MAEQLPISYLGALTDAIASDMLQDEAVNQGQDRTNMPPAVKTEDGGRIDRPSSAASRQQAAALLLSVLTEVVMSAPSTSESDRANLLSRLAILKGVRRDK